MPTSDLVLPRNVEAEAALLGGLMCDNKLIDPIADVVRAEDFFEPLHGRMFEAFLIEHNCGRPVTPITIKSLFADDPTLQELGGGSYLAKLTANPAIAMLAKAYAAQIAAMSKRRHIITELARAQTLAADMSASPEDIVAAADAALAADDPTMAGLAAISAHDAFWQMIEEAKSNKHGVTAPNLKSLNEAMGPARPHHLCVVAGRPGMGKTAVALSYALSAAQAGFGVLYVTLEMNAGDLMQRMTADMLFKNGSGVPYSAIRDYNLHGDALKHLHACGHALRGLPITIVDKAGITIGRLSSFVRRHCRRMEAKGTPLNLVIVDYLQLLEGSGKAGSNRANEIAEVSRGLKGIAKANNVAVMALAQLNRAVESREDKRPKLYDLRESGQIEQDADAVVLLHRRAYYLKDDPPKAAELAECENEIEFICAKRRNGRSITTRGEFYGTFQAVRG